MANPEWTDPIDFERTRMMPCRLCCGQGGKARHHQNWRQHVTLGGSVHCWSCCNCGEMKIPQSAAVLVWMPSEAAARWATKDERRLLRGRLA